MSALRKCKYCGKPSDELSVRRICKACGFSRMTESQKQLKQKSGDIYEKWIEGRRQAALRLLKIAADSNKE